MTVKELMELLQKTDPSFEVFLETEISAGYYALTSMDESTDANGTIVILTDFPVDPH